MRHRPWIVLAVTALTSLSLAPNAAAASNGWGLSAMRVPSAHSLSQGEGATVAIIDTGIKTGHPALKGRATEGPDFLDEDDQNEPWYGRHGTSMASSVLDVAPRAKILGLRVLRDEEDPDYKTWEESMQDGGDTEHSAAVARAIDYAVEENVDVISMSLGGAEGYLTRYDGREAQAIQAAINKGIVVLASAGNSAVESPVGENNKINYPAAYPGVIAVAAAAPDGSRAEFSQVHNYNDVTAPGVGINSADIDGGRSQVNGTSSATALTAGVAGLIVSKYPELAPRQVEQALRKTASNYSQGHSPLTGYGNIDAPAALQAAAKLQPQKPTLPVGNKNVDVHFGPGNDGTPQRIDVGRNPEDTTVALVIGGPGLAALVLGSILTISGVRARRRGEPGGH